MDQHKQRVRCSVCGYVYDPEKGERKQGIAPGVCWEAVNPNFTCPLCGQGKAAFEPICTDEFPGKCPR